MRQRCLRHEVGTALVAAMVVILSAVPLWAVDANPKVPVPGVGSPQSAFAKPQLSESDEEDSYTVQKGDRIKVTIYPGDEYLKGGEMEVSSEGNITLPLVGKIPIAGKSVIDAEKTIARLVGADYLVAPEVVIEVLRFKQSSVILLGQVKKPGTYTFPEGSARLSLLQAIALAGGFSDIANIKKIKIVRRTADKSRVIRANADAIISGKSQDVDLESGDVIHVMESLF